MNRLKPLVQAAGRAMGMAMARQRDVDLILLTATDMKCPECGRQYKRFGWLRRHYRIKHHAE